MTNEHNQRYSSRRDNFCSIALTSGQPWRAADCPLRWERKRGMDVRALKELCQRLDELAAISPSAHLQRVASAALRGALAEIKRLEANADLHQKALRDALGEIERLRSDAHRHRELRDAATDWVTKFLERKRA